MDEDCGMENTVGVEVEVLDAVVPQKAFEEIAGRQRESALREAREHWNLILALLHGVRVPGGGPPTVHLLLTDESTVEESQQILGLHLRFFPLAAWIWQRWRHRLRCSCGSPGGLFAAPLLPGGLRRLGRRWLHSPS
jgi:hypothetical protein